MSKEHNKTYPGHYLRDEFKKWFLNLVTSIKTLPKRHEAPPPPHHPDESLEPT